MGRRKPTIKDPFYRKIIEGLEGHLGSAVFEHCMGDLLRSDFPGLAPVPGGSDSGWDGAIPGGEGEPFPLICTTQERVLANLTKSLDALSRSRFKKGKVALATSQALTPRRRAKLFARAEEKGYTLVQVIEQQGLADRLQWNSFWCEQLLQLSGKPSPLSSVPLTCRPLLELKPIGRGEDIAWLAATREDRVLVGEPGSGKTFLFHHLIHHGGWDALFLVSRDKGAIATAIEAGSLQSWAGLAALGPELAQWALDHYPGDVGYIAGGALEGDPVATIPRLLEEAARSTSRHDRLHMLSNWVRVLGVPSEALLERRRHVARAVKRYLRAGGAVGVGIEALTFVLSPTLERRSFDPGVGRNLTISSAVIPSNWLSRLTELWDEVLPAVPSLGPEGWSHLAAALWDWIHPENAYRNAAVPPEAKTAMQDMARKILTDLSPLVQESPGIAAKFRELGIKLGVEIPLATDSIFEPLYPEDLKAIEGEGTAALSALGAAWASREPREVAQALMFYGQEAAKIGRQWQRNAAKLCEEIATQIEEPEIWAAAFAAEGASADLVSAFWMAAAQARRPGWEEKVEGALTSGRRGYRWAATDLVLQHPAPPTSLLDLALSRAPEFPELVEGLCLGKRASLAVLGKLFQHPDWETALAAVVGE